MSYSQIRVLVWSERTEPADVYPDGINGAIAAALKKDKKLAVRTAQLSDPDSGVSDATLDATDVLIWFGHQKHNEVSPEVIARIVRHVKEKGMGYLPVHSSHFALPFKAVLDEIQKAPELLPAIKRSVDRHRSPGRFPGGPLRPRLAR